MYTNATRSDSRTDSETPPSATPSADASTRDGSSDDDSGDETSEPGSASGGAPAMFSPFRTSRLPNTADGENKAVPDTDGASSEP